LSEGLWPRVLLCLIETIEEDPRRIWAAGERGFRGLEKKTFKKYHRVRLRGSVRMVLIIPRLLQGHSQELRDSKEL
jgi:hypothetical protein